MEGYLHKHSLLLCSFKLYPCPLSISLWCLFHSNPQICTFWHQSMMSTPRKRWALKVSFHKCEEFHRNWLACALVSTLEMHLPFCVFHILMHPSWEPPPEASTLNWYGHHARALTAAQWSLNRNKKFVDFIFAASHTYTRLSLPPLASNLPSFDHFKPHTSWVCARMWEAKLLPALTDSLKGILESRKTADRC